MSLDESFADIFGILTVYFTACYLRGDFATCVDYINIPDSMTRDPEAVYFPSTYKGYYYTGNENCGSAASCYHRPDQTVVSCDNAKFDPSHWNASVQSYMFYLLAAGGSGTNDPPLSHPYNVEGIGPGEAGQIAFQTMLARLSPTSTYPEARDAWIAA